MSEDVKERIKRIVTECILELKQTNGLSFELTDDTVLLGEGGCAGLVRLCKPSVRNRG